MLDCLKKVVFKKIRPNQWKWLQLGFWEHGVAPSQDHAETIRSFNGPKIFNHALSFHIFSAVFYSKFITA